MAVDDDELRVHGLEGLRVVATLRPRVAAASKTVAILRRGGHEVVAASPSSGVNSITGEGLKEAVAGAQVVIDLANSPSFEDKAVLEFFETSGRNLLAAEGAAGVRHHVALSIVGTDRSDNGYFRPRSPKRN
jgi:uncharacterized protein YbjT (DUF2867 family)